MSAALRWTLVVLVLSVASVVALWPRTGGQQSPSPAALSARPVADLTALRAKAALLPCPSSGSGKGPATLSGVRATCLGDGSSVDLAAALAGHATLINVWASWCQPCQQELPVLAAYSATPGAVPVLGIQVQNDGTADGLSALASLGVHFPSAVDADGSVSKALRLPMGLPASYVVRPDGQVLRVTSPLVFSTPDEVRLTVDKYLGSPA